MQKVNEIQKFNRNAENSSSRMAQIRIANDLLGVELVYREASKIRFCQFHANRERGFYERGTMTIPSSEISLF